MKKADKMVGPMNGNFYLKYDGNRKPGKYHATYFDLVQCKRILGELCKELRSSVSFSGKMIGNNSDGSDIDVRKVKRHERQLKKKVLRRAIRQLRREKELQRYLKRPQWARAQAKSISLAEEGDDENDADAEDLIDAVDADADIEESM